MKLSKPLIVMIAVIGAGQGLLFLGLYFWTATTASQTSPIQNNNNSTVEMIEAFNNGLPAMIDPDTRLDSVTFSDEEIKTVQYYYTLVNTLQNEVNYSLVKTNLRNTIVGRVKNDVPLKVFKDPGYYLQYIYYDRDGEFVWKFTVTPEMYNE